MRSRAAGPLTVIANLAAFSACACLAYARNLDAVLCTIRFASDRITKTYGR